jgi:hypothetical protein
MNREIVNMEPGKIYFISYGGTTLIARYKGDDTCDHLLYDYLHNWAGFETFYYHNCMVVKSGIEEIRRASDAEKQSLLRHSIANNSI